MAKKKELKKKNLKLRRQIRRTFGALFMASAIVVAAIPVNDIEAGVRADAVINDTRNSVAGNTSTWEKANAYANYTFSDDGTLDPSGILTPKSTDQIYTSQIIRQLSNDSWSLNWQFEYYKRNMGVSPNISTRAIISKYNSTYPETTVVLSNQANVGYYTVTTEAYDKFYLEGNPGYKKFVLTYEEYNTQNNKNREFFETYRKATLTEFDSRCAAYDKYLAEKKAHDDWADSDPKGAEPTNPIEVKKPADVTFITSTDFTPEEMLKYYCDLSGGTGGNLPGKGYSLVAVTDNVTAKYAEPDATAEPGATAEPDATGGTATRIYVARGGTPREPAYNDANGFLVTDVSIEIIGIGKKAFDGVKNVDYLTIPDEIKYIGDEAFVNSFIKSISMGNVANIGNKAFKLCSQLSTVTLKGTENIGTQCFQGSGITTIKFPYSLSKVGKGAFADCTKLAEVDFSEVTAACEVDDYAFFNCSALNNVNMADSAVTRLGIGAFALTTNATGSWTQAILPSRLAKTSTVTDPIGECLFERRSNLKTVTFPSEYGTAAAVTIPEGMFRNCINLESVEFPDNGSGMCGYVNFGKLLFLDVLNTAFCVKGPEKTMDGNRAKPREATWAAFSRVEDYIPYIYKDSKTGLMCYEICNGQYILQANEKGQFTSCVLYDTSAKNIDLVIPSKVGGYIVTSIADGCFADENLRKELKTITIADDSLTAIDANVFSGLPKLESVVIGNSVQSIGEKAFANCPKLIDVTFHTPSGGYEGFTIGNEAFKTGSPQLTMHGDIVPGYAPFEFATGKTSGLIDSFGKRICYKSLSPDYLTVMYDAKSGEVTLLEYPKYVNLDADHAAYIEERKAYFYDLYGADKTKETKMVDGVEVTTYYDASEYKNQRAAFLKEVEANGVADAYKSIYYGPWVDKAFIEDIKKHISGDSDVVAWLDNGEDDVIIQANKVELANLKPFYDVQKYSIKDNFERGSNTRGEFEGANGPELEWIHGTQNIVIPAGVTSIDAYGFFTATENTTNVSTYFNRTTDDYKMCTDDKGKTVTPGLFSGYYQDYDTDSALEKQIKGNDRILSVIMSTVKSLPDYAFDSCERLQSVVLGEGCTDIGTAPFRGCTSLDTVAGNSSYIAENGLIYSVNPDESYTIEECLAGRGNLDKIKTPYINSTTDPAIAKVSAITPGAFEDCDHITRVYLDTATQLKILPQNCFNDCEKLQSVDLPESIKRIEDKAFGGNKAITVTIPSSTTNIATDAFEHESTNTIVGYKGGSPEDYADFYDIYFETMDSKYKVVFIDHDTTPLCDAQYIAEGKSAVAPEEPVREGYTFTGWFPSFTNVTSDLIVLAQYTSNTQDENKFTVTFYDDNNNIVGPVQKIAKGDSAVAPLPPVKSGYTFKEWKPNTYTNVQKDLDIIAYYEKNESSSASPGASGSGTSPTPTASGTSSSSTNEGTKYTASVSGGSGSGSYAAGTVVTISAYATGDGKVFDKWTTASTGVGFLDATSATTTFTMPAGNVTITATYKTALSASTGSGNAATSSSGTGGTGGSSNNNGTTVQITKPGITDSGFASVNGSLDNFVVKITEDAAATTAAVEALQRQYGDISKIRYLPMDISLYDSTGTTKITDTAGITVDITIPLPNDLVSYAGNNKAASTAGGVLENLNSKFTTIDGVPYINFTATHFSPYVIYVDTENLTEGMIDATPKTGDFLHPKWFLVIGLASMSMLLFLKRDKSSTIKPA